MKEDWRIQFYERIINIFRKIKRGSAGRLSERLNTNIRNLEKELQDFKEPRIEKLGLDDKVSVPILGNITREVYDTEAAASEAVGFIVEGLREAQIVTNSEFLKGYDSTIFQEKPGYKNIQKTVELYFTRIDT